MVWEILEGGVQLGCIWSGILICSSFSVNSAFGGYNARLEGDEEWRRNLRDAHLAHKTLRKRLVSNRTEDSGFLSCLKIWKDRLRVRGGFSFFTFLFEWWRKISGVEQWNTAFFPSLVPPGFMSLEWQTPKAIGQALAFPQEMAKVRERMGDRTVELILEKGLCALDVEALDVKCLHAMVGDELTSGNAIGRQAEGWDGERVGHRKNCEKL